MVTPAAEHVARDRELLERIAQVEGTCNCGISFKTWISELGEVYGPQDPENPRAFESVTLVSEWVGPVTVATMRGDAIGALLLIGPALYYLVCEDCWNLPDARLGARALATKLRRKEQ